MNGTATTVKKKLSGAAIVSMIFGMAFAIAAACMASCCVNCFEAPTKYLIVFSAVSVWSASSIVGL